MKRFISLLLTTLLIFTLTAIPVLAVNYESPLASGAMGSDNFRIPALYTLNDGSVLIASDMRYNHEGDSPNNLDIILAKSPDGYGNWDYKAINYFDDYADTVTNTASASFIDSAIVQS